MVNLQKYIWSQDNRQCWNVSHIAGYSIQELRGGLIGIKAHSRISASDVVPVGMEGIDGVFIYSSQSLNQTTQVFNNLLGFLCKNDEVLFNCAQQ